jgi:hypothetical protein
MLQTGGIMRTFVGFVVICCFIGLFLVDEALADLAVDTVWHRSYDGPLGQYDDVWGMAVDESGNVYVAGATDVDPGDYIDADILVIKYLPNGDTAWVRQYGGPPGSNDVANDIAVHSSGYVAVAGTSEGGMIMLLYDIYGELQWMAAYGDGQATAVTFDNRGFPVMTGYSWTFERGDDITTICYDIDGVEQWTRLQSTYVDYQTEDRGAAIGVDIFNNIVVAGTSTDTTYYKNYCTVKYDEDGNRQWVTYYTTTYSGWSEDRLNALAVGQDANADIYVTGQSRGANADYDFATVKYNSFGSEEWVRRYEGEELDEDDIAYDIALAQNGDAFVVGASKGADDYHDYMTIKYHSEGTKIWDRRYDWGWHNYAFRTCTDQQDNVYITGHSFTSSGSSAGGRMMSYDPDGNLRWTFTNCPGFPQGIAVDLYGSIYVAGHSGYAGSSSSYTHTYRYWQSTSPGTFSLILPEDSAVVSYNVEFDWEDSYNPESWEDLYYDLHLSASSVFDPDSTIVVDSIDATGYVDSVPGGWHYWKVRAYDDYLETWSTESWSVHTYYPGDADGSGAVDIDDAVTVIAYIFSGGDPPYPLPAGDADCSGDVDIDDVVYVITYIFGGGPPPGDPNDDGELDC